MAFADMEIRVAGPAPLSCEGRPANMAMKWRKLVRFVAR